MKIVVMGQGYVGLPLAMAAAQAGHEVVGFEPDPVRLSQLRLTSSYVEDVDSSWLRVQTEIGQYTATDDPQQLKGFDVAVITVPTPLKDGVPDLTYVNMAAYTVGEFISPGSTVVLESTTYPGTTRDRFIPMLQARTYGLQPGRDYHVGFSPERIDPGNRTWTFANTPKIISGLTPDCLQKIEQFYRSITQNVVLANSLECAELAKCFENTFRQVNIALVNELGRMANLLGADVWHTLDLCASKPFGFMKFTPGPGVGGHCLPVDPMYLAHQTKAAHGETFRLIELAQDINTGQPAYVVSRLQDALNDRQGRALRQSRILALGASYKPDTADRRESPAVEVVELLRKRGAHVDVVDPYFDTTGMDLYEYTEIPNPGYYNAVVLLTEHTAFDLPRVANEAVFVLDTRGVIAPGDNIERL